MRAVRGGVVVLAIVGSLTGAGCRGEPAAEADREEASARVEEAGSEGPADSRRVVALPDSVRAGVRSSMVAMLATVHGTARALAEGDTARARELAAGSGTSAAGMRAPGIREAAPREFLGIAMRNHQAFDRLARAASEGASADSLFARLAEVTGACVECHQTFRAETANGPARE